MKKRFDSLMAIINQEGELRKKCNEAVTALNESPDYSVDYKREMRGEIDKFFKNQSSANRTEAKKALVELMEVVSESTRFDMSKMEKVTKTIDYIRSVSGKIDYDSRKAIEDSFKGDMHSLKALNSAFEQYGVPTHTLKEQLCEPSDELKMIEAIMSRAFMANGSMNVIAGEIGELANKLNVEVTVPYFKGETPTSYLATKAGIV